MNIFRFELRQMSEERQKTNKHPVSHERYITALEARLQFMSFDDLMSLDLDLQHLQYQTRFLIRNEAKNHGSR